MDDRAFPPNFYLLKPDHASQNADFIQRDDVLRMLHRFCAERGVEMTPPRSEALAQAVDALPPDNRSIGRLVDVLRDPDGVLRTVCIELAQIPGEFTKDGFIMQRPEDLRDDALAREMRERIAALAFETFDESRTLWDDGAYKQEYRAFADSVVALLKQKEQN